MIKLDSANIHLLVDDTKKLTYIIIPENTTKNNVSWTSSDKNIVAVDSTGTIKGMGLGEAQITAKTTNNLSAITTVKVKPIIATKIIINKTS